ncbi:PTS transporter subunit EIIB [Faecalibaculum rodentium]|uniref:PTS transporter subunit EIIB n=1 Tax=Faecalibaculum rodentium TaxID=1702221 RepID=UPI0023F0466D|nr:PTS transporter subunit EIIB [Faecalibaculum rodentium]
MVKYVGGSSNIQSVTNCMTRLRLILKDPARADIKAMQALDGVQGGLGKKVVRHKS